MDRKIDNIDSIAVMSDDELHNKINSVEWYLAKRNDHAAEVDLCYYQREVEIRINRKIRHDAWLAKNS